MSGRPPALEAPNCRSKSSSASALAGPTLTLMHDDEAADVVRAVELAFGLVAEFPGGSTLVAVMEQWPALQRVRAQAMVSELIELLSDSEHGLVRRLQEDQRVLRLVWATTSAAADADTEAKIRTLANVASIGLNDDAKLDEATFLVETIRELHAIDVRLLLALEAADLAPDTGLNTAGALGVSRGVAEALNAKLLRLALVETPGMSFRGLHAEVRLSEFGRELLDALRRHGNQSPLR